MAKLDDGQFVCDYCHGESGEFDTETDNHLACEEIEELKKKLLGSNLYIVLEDGKVQKIVDSSGSIVENAHVINLDDVFEDVCPVCKEEFAGVGPCQKCGYDFREDNIVEAANRAYGRRTNDTI